MCVIATAYVAIMTLNYEVIIMGRGIVRNNITSPDILANINPENQKLKREFLRYLRSLKRSDGTVRTYSNDLDIFFTFLFNECDNKSIIDCNIRDFVNFQGYLLDENNNSPARVRRDRKSTRK